ncbi:hypothetical protein V6R21_17885 [Limibacter armeniacum]|uniref:hypothetical protein n=1 Tax=Limibacter armeniacum TaxID=466084 RepID=UPI002FE60ECF
MNKLLMVVGAAVILLSAGCSKSVNISDEDFDMSLWKNDKNGCKGERLTILDDFKAVKDELLGVNELGVQKYLGKPDFVELASRNGKYYVYFVSTGKQCEGSGVEITGDYFRVRFTPLNLVKEISYHKGTVNIAQ